MKMQFIPAAIALLTAGAASSSAQTISAQTSHSGCYIIDEANQFYDLGSLCGSFSGGEPVLQTGDIQVTLRWQTEDDLDLVVTDPSGDTVSYFSPAVASGGQLDVDANAYCENAGFSPVENIFWPTGEAPAGSYTAYVVLSIPCTETTTTVDYTLTVLNQGQTQTYSGSTGLGVVEVPYPFALSR